MFVRFRQVGHQLKVSNDEVIDEVMKGRHRREKAASLRVLKRLIKAGKLPPERQP
jgi:hypothetical protein